MKERSCRSVERERVGLAPGEVEAAHQLRTRTLPERLPLDHNLQFGNHLGGAAVGKAGRRVRRARPRHAALRAGGSRSARTARSGSRPVARRARARAPRPAFRLPPGSRSARCPVRPARHGSGSRPASSRSGPHRGPCATERHRCGRSSPRSRSAPHPTTHRRSARSTAADWRGAAATQAAHSPGR